MAKITRALQKIFGVNASAGQLGKVGSLAAGTPETTTNVEEMQELINYSNGMYSVTVGNNSPAQQDINSLHFIATRQLAYLFQQGIPEWNDGTEYHIGSFVNDADGNIYKSIVNNNLGVATSDPANWTLMFDGSSNQNSIVIHSDTNGGFTESVAKITPAGAISGVTDADQASSTAITAKRLRPNSTARGGFVTGLTGSGSYTTTSASFVSVTNLSAIVEGVTGSRFLIQIMSDGGTGFNYFSYGGIGGNKAIRWRIRRGGVEIASGQSDGQSCATISYIDEAIADGNTSYDFQVLRPAGTTSVYVSDATMIAYEI